MSFEKIKKFKIGFQQFISKGDVLKLAIAFIMGQLFTKIISSLTIDIIMPPINYLFNDKYSIKDWRFELAPNVFINYGNFIQNIFEFILISLFIYTILVYFFQKLITKNNDSENKQKQLQIEIEKREKEKIILLQEIKDILNKNQEIK
ncbi:large conductance mechanosensitive channel protein MscL ['Camptotheca acuminata' phytoplasma]|uniref:large conductance mechanosensitive channel protein MscL n=1 Tax='Camptotheca acuminata' phytoplasma TaxID=3239192 RepID=UPI00351A56A8